MYRAADGVAKIEVCFGNETFWRTQCRMGEFFGMDVRTINYHLKEIFDSGELDPKPTIPKNRRLQIEVRREVARDLEYYSLDRVSLDRATVSDFEKEAKRIARRGEEQ